MVTDLELGRPRLRALIKTLFAFMKRNYRHRYFWIQWSLPFRVINLLVGLATWFFFGWVAAGGDTSVPMLEAYGGSFISYLIIGMALNTILSFNMSAFYGAITNAYTWGFSYGGGRMSMMDYIRLARIPPSVLTAAHILDGYVESGLDMAAYLALGAFFFGFSFSPEANIAAGLTAFLLGIVATLGLGMISASMFWLINARAGREPVQWIIGLFASLAAGVYFPPEVLPAPLRMAGELLPQTYSLRVCRLSLLGGASWCQVLPGLVILGLFAAVLFPLGFLLLRYSFQVGQKKASVW